MYLKHWNFTDCTLCNFMGESKIFLTAEWEIVFGNNKEQKVKFFYEK